MLTSMVDAATLVMSFKKFLLLSDAIIIVVVEHCLDDAAFVGAAGEKARAPLFADRRMDAVRRMLRLMVLLLKII